MGILSLLKRARIWCLKIRFVVVKCHFDTVKIEVHRKALEPGLLAKPDQLLAVITDEYLDVRVPQFDLMKNNIIQITDLIEKWLSVQLKRKMGHAVDNKLEEITIV